MTINTTQYELLYSLYTNLQILKHSKITNKEQITLRNNMIFLFQECDKNKISFKIQNIVLGLAEIKGNKDRYLKSLLNENNIIIEN